MTYQEQRQAWMPINIVVFILCILFSMFLFFKGF